MVYMFGDELQRLMRQVKQIFDPQNILNPGVKTITNEELKTLLRPDYHLAHRHEHLPRS
jgi:hypothetical protein